MVATAGGAVSRSRRSLGIAARRVARRLRPLPLRVPGLDGHRGGAALLCLAFGDPGRWSPSPPSPRSASSSCTGTTSGACSPAPSRASRGPTRPGDGTAAARRHPGARRGVTGTDAARARGRGSRARACRRARGRGARCGMVRHGLDRGPADDHHRPRDPGRLRLPPDGVDRAAERAAQISSDVDEIGAWWRSQDFEREPRFDRAAFPCGAQADIVVVRLPDSAAALQVNGSRFEQIANVVGRRASQGSRSISSTTTGRSPRARRAARGEVNPDGEGIAIVYMATCSLPFQRGRRGARAAARLRGPSRPAGRRTPAPTRVGQPVRQHGRHPLSVRADGAAQRARARRRPQRLLRPRRGWLDVQDSPLAAPRDAPGAARADDRRRAARRERRPGTRLRRERARPTGIRGRRSSSTRSPPRDSASSAGRAPAREATAAP